MELNLVTMDDLSIFKKELLEELAVLVKPSSEKKAWLRSGEVREMLGISASTLQNLRVSNTLNAKKVNGMLFYKYEDLVNLMKD